MSFFIGQELRLKFGSSGATQVAVVERVTIRRVFVRRFRAASGKWNKRRESWNPEALASEVKEVREMMAAPDRRAFLASYDPANQEG